MRRSLALTFVCGLVVVLGSLVPGARAPAGGESAPSPRESATIAYDSESDRVILFGGNTNLKDASQVSSETWSYDFDSNTWTKMAPAASPPGLGTAGMAYDSESDRIVLFGGFRNGFADTPATPALAGETWAYDFNHDTWAKRNPAQTPASRCCVSMGYDRQSDRVILVGGFDGTSRFDTWAYNYNSDAWTAMNPPTNASTGDSAAIAYDSESDRIVVSSGFVENPHGDTNVTWAYDFNGNSWTQEAPGLSPPRRWIVKGAYDSGSDRVVIFGGYQGFGNVALHTPLEDTWAYDLNADAWRDMSPAAHPSARCCHSMAYDAGSDRIVLFGGRTGKFGVGAGWSDQADTWTYDFNTNTWKDMTRPSSSPPGLPLLLMGGVTAALVAAAAVVIGLLLRRQRTRRGQKDH